MRRVKNYHEIVGDGGSNILQQVGEQKARIAGRLAGVRRMLAIGSGKGGVGKSTLTLQLATELRGRGRSVGILDADLNGPAQARLAGLRAAPLVPGRNGLAIPRSRTGIGVVSLGTMVPEPRAIDFDSVAQGESHTWRATREFTALGELLGAVEWGELDYLLVDLPPGAERTQQYAEFLGRETCFVLVTIPSELARGVVARSVSALRQTPNRVLGYVQNMDGYYCRDCGEVKPLFGSTEAVDLTIPCLGRVPFDPQLAALCDRGGSVLDLPSSAAAEGVKNVTDRLLEALGTNA